MATRSTEPDTPKRQYNREHAVQVRKMRRDMWLAEHGPCRKCGSDEELEIDHIDPKTKAINVDMLWRRHADVRNAELAKCQVLCRKCHRLKTNEEAAMRMGGWSRCGSYSRYIRGCRCEKCCEANTQYHIRRRRRKGIPVRVIVDEVPVEGAAHGTRKGYEQQMCRCKECRAFNAGRSAQHLARVRRKREQGIT